MAYSDYGGKPYPEWKNGDFNFPGYKNAILELHNVRNGGVVRHGFLVSPSNFSEQRSNNAQMNKTTAGWVVYRTGKGLGTLSLAGITLDTKEMPERLTFLKRITDYIEDGYNDRFETKNDWLQYFIIEGVMYSGYMQSISFTKNGQSPYVYQYNLTFIVYSDNLQHRSNSQDSATQNAMDLLSGAVGSSDSKSIEASKPKRLSANLLKMLSV